MLLHLLLLIACAHKGDDTGAPVEPLVLPDAPAANGAPVGERTVSANGQTVEIWYPATDATADQPTEWADFGPFVPASVTQVLGPIDLPTVQTGAVRDAPLRNAGQPYSVVVFSHGFGGMRLQSLDYAVHLASRGYVVLAPDHPGRMMGDLLPCLFSPPLDGCDLTGMTGADPAIADVEDTVDWLFAGGTFLDGQVDLSHMAMTGHSAGGGTTASVLDQDSRFTAGIALAAGAEPQAAVPLLLMGGSCDAFATDASMQAARDATDGHSTLVELQDAGHLAFSDLCQLDLLGLAATVLAPREDVNQALLAQLVGLASDGCPGAVPEPALEACGETYLPLDTSAPIVRWGSTVFLDQALKGAGEGIGTSPYAEASVR